MLMRRPLSHSRALVLYLCLDFCVFSDANAKEDKEKRGPVLLAVLVASARVA